MSDAPEGVELEVEGKEIRDMRWRSAKRSARVLGPILLALVLLGSCRGSEQEATPGESGRGSSRAIGDQAGEAWQGLGGDACRLLAREEIAETLGHQVLEGRAMGSLNCLWDTEGIDETSVSLTAFVSREGSRDMVEVCADLRASGDEWGPAPVEVPGVGEEAWWTFTATPALNTGQLWACSNDAVLGLSLAGVAVEDEMLAAARELLSGALGQV